MDDVTRLGRCVRCGADLSPESGGELCAACRRALNDAPTMLGGQPTMAAGLPGEAPTMISAPAVSSSEQPTFLSGMGSSGGRPRGPRPSPGQAFGPYIIDRPLGSGGMGDVYEAAHVEHGRRVALKILGHRLAGPDDLSRFLREGELAASITHPNTVYVFGSEEIDGSPVIAMELLSGGTLKDLVQANGPLQSKEAVDLMLQVMAGLEAAAAAGILHRDIKPANCFIDRDGSVKVGDFGLSISTSGREQRATGLFQGTPQFAPPEQIRGEALDVRADIYAVGATLFYLLTGKPPFDDADLTTLINRVQAETARSPREMRSGVPQALANVVSRWLSKDRKNSPATYAELEDDLRPFSSSAPKPAPLGRRLLAGIIDVLASSFIIAPMAMPLTFHQQGAVFQWSVHAVKIATALAYYALLEGLFGAAAGKAICGIAVAREDGRRPGFGRALARAAIYELPTMLGLIPVAIVGAVPYMQFTLEQPLLAGAIATGFSSLLLVLFSTARKANGFAALHDRATGTRVVRRQNKTARVGLEALADLQAPAAVTPRRRGPFEITGTLGQTNEGDLLTAIDPRLKRHVWIHERPADAAAIAPALRDLSRPGRLRWLGGGRDRSAVWDAYEALDGAPLLAIGAPQPWALVKRWLLDLAVELDASLAAGSLPALSLDRIWITAAGHARLLDFRAPSVAA